MDRPPLPPAGRYLDILITDNIQTGSASAGVVFEICWRILTKKIPRQETGLRRKLYNEFPELHQPQVHCGPRLLEQRAQRTRLARASNDGDTMLTRNADVTVKGNVSELLGVGSDSTGVCETSFDISQSRRR